MIIRKKLAWHVIKVTGLAMFATVLLLTFLQILFSYLAELKDLSTTYNAFDAFRFILWESPDKMLELLPISALIGAVVGLGAMASNSELIVMRSVGISLWRIVCWVCVPAVLLIVLSFSLRQWVIPYTSERAKIVKQHDSSAKLGEVRGYWSKENQKFIYIDYANVQGQLTQVQSIDFDENYRIQQMLIAPEGQFVQAGLWQLKDATQVNILSDGQAVRKNSPTQDLSLALKPEFVHMVTADPEDLSPTQLLGFMQYLQHHSQVPKKYELAFWKLMAAPLSLIALVIVACSFVFGPLRQQSMGFRLVISLFVGLGFYYLQDFFGYASLVYSPSAMWFVFLPILMVMLLGMYLLHRMR